jgi:tetratricopeptide (TPR) repeat protein
MIRRRFLRTTARLLFLLGLSGLFLGTAARAQNLQLSPEASATLEKIYAFDLAGAVTDAKRIQQEQPEHPLGYLLEAEALWWRMWCTAAEYKYGMTNAWRRPKIPADERYLELAMKAATLARSRLKTAGPQKNAELQLYAGLGDAFAARLYGLRGEARATARVGVRAREHFLHAKQLDPDLPDADFGLGLYNYYVDTLSGIAKFLGFFMGIPGGSKQEGIRQLEHDIASGVLTPAAARFYLAINLHRYDQQYERALTVITPLVEKYPSNPLFQLVRGDLLGKLARKEQAIACYRAATALPVEDADCRSHMQQLVRVSLAAQEPSSQP